MKIYIAGPMTGLPQNNFPAFDAAAAMMRAEGHEIVSPAELDDPSDRDLAMRDLPATKSWGDFLARDVKLIADSGIEGILLLPDWFKSRGARLEATVGLLCDLHFMELSSWGTYNDIHSSTIAWMISRTFK
jgi:hypothetical protein